MAGGGSSRALAAPKYVPGSTWTTVDPGEAGWDPAGLRAIVRFAGERRSTTLLVVHRGRIVAERSWGPSAGQPREIASCQKSVVSLLAGRAAARGLLDRDDRVSAHLGEGWSNAPTEDERRICLRHLLTMTSGLNGQLRVVAPPGTVWSDNNVAYHVLQPVLEEATGRGIDNLSRRWLWAPLGAGESTWRPRPGNGPNAVDPKGRRLWGLAMTAREMGRFGLLVQRRGRWAEDQILPREELVRALTPSSELNPSYGELWWLNGHDGWRRGPNGALQPGPFVASAPDDMVGAFGRDGQRIYVVRSADLVVVRQGEPPGGDFDTELWRRLQAARPA
ncbi:serine hydrolase [soil metagenome]